MKKISLIILFLTTSWLTSYASVSDSIRSFLVGIGETEPYISIAANTVKPFTFEEVYTAYCQGLHYTTITRECRTANFTVNHQYVIDCIVNDTMVDLLRILPQGYDFYGDCDSLVECYRFAMEQYNSIEAASSLENIYYQRLRRMGHSIGNEYPFFYSAMASCVLGFSYDIIFRESLVSIPQDSMLLAEENLSAEEFQMLYSIDRNKYYHYIPQGLSYKILSPIEQEELDSLLTTGAQLGSHWCQARLAFALITGVLLKKDSKRGQDLLVAIWPQMADSKFWDFIDTD